MTCGGLLLKLELFMSILSHMLRSFFLTLPLCHLLFFLGTLIGPSAPLIISSLQGISDNIYPKEYTNDSKQGLCCHRAEGHPLCYNRVDFNISVSIESLSHVLNNVPSLFIATSIFSQVKAKICKIVLKNTSTLICFYKWSPNIPNKIWIFSCKG